MCNQLGFLDAKSAVKNSAFGKGSGPIQLDDVRCVGTESTLTDCPARPVQQHNCNHDKDAGVVCNPCPIHECKRDGVTTYPCGSTEDESTVQCPCKKLYVLYDNCDINYIT